ncbi:MAG: HAMP domain-containing sensor histidine kinase [Planctomycetota bacterium]|nr:HAMP domain-containing sensor histidine kinase [Planctomycetota bacterium]
MLRLPELTVGSVSWHLPLTDWAATKLAGLLLADDSEQRTRDLEAILTDEPALAVWCVCRARHWQQLPNGSRELASWFAVHGLHVLQWPAVKTSESPAADEQRQATWANWAAESVVAARVAARLAGEGVADRACLVALLHRASDWLDSSCDRRGGEEESVRPTCLPAWLKVLLGNLTEPTTTDQVVAAAAHAVASVGTDTENADLGSDFETDRRHASGVRQRWLVVRDASTCWLPLLTRKLARLEELEAEFQTTLETEKLQALKALAYGASHEINNPLANISTRAQTLLREETDPERRRKLAVINSQAFRAHEMISDLMLFAQPPELRWESVDLTALVDQVLAELAADAAEQETALIRVTPDRPLHCRADGVHLAVALKAICRNSLEAVSRGGRIELSAQEIPAPPHDASHEAWVELRVHDTGPGIPAHVRRHLFDPYFSGREAGRGLGLGLSKCWRIITDHGGLIDVASEPERGTVFCLRLPPASRLQMHSAEDGNGRANL